jgi:hypothetical protein
MPHRATREWCALGSSCSVLTTPSLHTAVRHWLHGQLSGYLSWPSTQPYRTIAIRRVKVDPSVAEKRVRWTPPLLTDACMVMGICPAKPVLAGSADVKTRGYGRDSCSFGEMIADDKQQAFVSMPQAVRTEIRMSLTASTKSLIATPRRQRVEEYWVTMGCRVHGLLLFWARSTPLILTRYAIFLVAHMHKITLCIALWVVIPGPRPTF